MYTAIRVMAAYREMSLTGEARSTLLNRTAQIDDRRFFYSNCHRFFFCTDVLSHSEIERDVNLASILALREVMEMIRRIKTGSVITLFSFVLCAACGNDTDESGNNSVVGTDPAGTDSTGGPTCQSAKQTILDMNFDDGQGAGSRLSLARPTADTDGNLVVTLDSVPDTSADTASDTGATDASEKMAPDTETDTDTIDTATNAIIPAPDTATDTADADTATETGAADTAADGMTYYVYPDNNTSVDWDGHPGALKIHADAQDDAGYGKSVEIQLALDAPVNMICEDYVVSFDIWTPKALVDAGGNAQFAFFDVESNTPIYSHWFGVESNRWVTVTGEVKAAGGDIDYSEFDNNPGDWIFDAFRLKIIADSAAEGQEFEYYVDNIKVTNIPEATADTSAGATGQ